MVIMTNVAKFLGAAVIVALTTGITAFAVSAADKRSREDASAEECYAIALVKKEFQKKIDDYINGGEDKEEKHERKEDAEAFTELCKTYPEFFMFDRSNMDEAEIAFINDIGGMIYDSGESFDLVIARRLLSAFEKADVFDNDTPIGEYSRLLVDCVEAHDAWARAADNIRDLIKERT